MPHRKTFWLPFVLAMVFVVQPLQAGSTNSDKLQRQDDAVAAKELFEGACKLFTQTIDALVTNRFNDLRKENEKPPQGVGKSASSRWSWRHRPEKTGR